MSVTPALDRELRAAAEALNLSVNAVVAAAVEGHLENLRVTYNRGQAFARNPRVIRRRAVQVTTASPLSLEGQEAILQGERIGLTSNEARVLGTLLERRGEPVTTAELAGQGKVNAARMVVTKLRQKIGRDSISFVKGAGYSLAKALLQDVTVAALAATATTNDERPVVELRFDWPETAEELVSWAWRLYEGRYENCMRPGIRGVIGAIRRYHTNYHSLSAVGHDVRIEIDRTIMAEMRRRYPTYMARVREPDWQGEGLAVKKMTHDLAA